MKAFLIAVGVMALFAATLVVCETCHVTGSVVDSANGVLDKTLDPNNVIYNYEFFKQSYQDIQALTAKIIDAQKAVSSFDSQFQSRKEMDREDKLESERLHAILTGLQQERQTEVAQYNARASEANRNIFKSNDVPNHIE
jgi:hypothetical protein